MMGAAPFLCFYLTVDHCQSSLAYRQEASNGRSEVEDLSDCIAVPAQSYTHVSQLMHSRSLLYYRF